MATLDLHTQTLHFKQLHHSTPTQHDYAMAAKLRKQHARNGSAPHRTTSASHRWAHFVPQWLQPMPATPGLLSLRVARSNGGAAAPGLMSAPTAAGFSAHAEGAGPAPMLCWHRLPGDVWQLKDLGWCRCPALQALPPTTVLLDRAICQAWLVADARLRPAALQPSRSSSSPRLCWLPLLV